MSLIKRSSSASRSGISKRGMLGGISLWNIRSWEQGRRSPNWRSLLDLSAALGVQADRGRASGGGARGRLWLEIVASVLGVPLELTAVEEGSAFGAALLGGVAGGVFTDVHDAVARCVRVRDVVEPNPASAETYAELYPRYRSLYPTLKGWDT